ncbi:hypothetical protein [Reinekea sp. G2M2-21]|uniref:hypothetical protein n=1 Tax=Reinekea sp. G2M2-21 TaxID=2788942 RepID=UPI0018AAF447|nr:hypothetical protein [Reinekea sp. G2M2-21]
MKPDYSRYSYSQLIQALHAIDRDKWPDRVEEIEAELQTDRIQTEISTIALKEEEYDRQQADNHLNKLKGLPIAYLLLVLVVYVNSPELLTLEGLKTVSPKFWGVILASLIFAVLQYFYYKAKTQGSNKR